ncbi:MAG: hypothetical protein JNL18_00680 [Planctomycetaceae bacterium]|nr:hypothetical protein [Planctomycetaceae bacterium]
MSIVLRGAALCLLASALCPGKVNAADIESIVFESGSVGPSGAPAATGWQFLSTNSILGDAQALIESVPDRTFQTGTNSEAMVLHPWFPANSAGTVFGHGAEWNTADALGAAPQTVDPGEIVYLQMEIFSDMAGGGQYWKLGSAVGFKGNGANPSVNRGFNDEATLGDNGKNLLTSIEADWTFDTTLDFNGAIRGSDLAQKQDQTRYLNPPTTEELDKTYISTAIFRQGVDAAAPFSGTETEVSEVLDRKNGGESSATGTSAPFEPWGGNSNVITGMTIDRAQVNVLRGSNNVEGGSITRVNTVSSFIDPFETDPNSPLYISNAVLGIKMFRFGTTSIKDVNLDGIVNAADKSIVTANQGQWPALDGTGATFFDGDVNNDLVVDALDLAFYVGTPGDADGDGDVDGADFLIGQRAPNFAAFLVDWKANFGTTPSVGAVPEPNTALLLICGAAALAAIGRRVG